MHFSDGYTEVVMGSSGHIQDEGGARKALRLLQNFRRHSRSAVRPALPHPSLGLSQQSLYMSLTESKVRA